MATHYHVVNFGHVNSLVQVLFFLSIQAFLRVDCSKPPLLCSECLPKSCNKPPIAADHQTVAVVFWWCKFGFGKFLNDSAQSYHHIVTIIYNFNIKNFLFVIRNYLLKSKLLKFWIENIMIQNTEIFIFIELMQDPLVKAFHIAKLLQIFWQHWNNDRKCLRHFFNILTWVLFNSPFQMPIVKSTWFSSMIVMFKSLIATTESLKPPFIFFS